MEQTMEPVAQTTPAQSAVETPTPAGAPGSAPTPPKSRKKRKKTTRRIIALVLVIALGFGLYRHFGKKEGAGEQQVVTDTVMYGSITSTVEGSGMVKAKNSETITLATAGTVTDVFVTEGQQVMAGDPLFTYDSPAAEKDVRDAKADIEGYQKKLNAAYKDIAALTLTAPYAGKLLETAQRGGRRGQRSEGRHARGRHADAPDAVFQLCLRGRALCRTDRAGLDPRADGDGRGHGGKGTYGQARDERGL